MAAASSADGSISDEELLDTWEIAVKGLASSFRKTYRLSTAESDDLEQELRAKLITIPQDKRHLQKYVQVVLNNRSRDIWRRLKRYQHRYLPVLTTPQAESSQFEAIDATQTITTLLHTLPIETSDIIIRHFGLFGGEPISVSRLARQIGKPEEEIQQTIDNAIAALRERTNPA